MMSLKKKFFLAAALVVIGTLVALIFVTPPAISDEPLPNPNGYDDFVRGAAMASEKSGNWNEMSLEELRGLVATNNAALEVIRTGLTKQSRVVPFELNSTNSSHLEALASQKRVAQAFGAASRLALIEGHTNEAAMRSIECIRFGQESARGGVLLDGLVGIAVQALGRARLEEALPGLDVETARKVVAALEKVADQCESPDEFFKRESQWARRGRFGPIGIFTPLFQIFQSRKDRARFEQKFHKAATDLQRTKLRAAARAYELDHGKPPATARDLVPQYLKSIPLDSTNGNELQLN